MRHDGGRVGRRLRKLVALILPATVVYSTDTAFAADAHVHGEADLEIVVDGADALVTLRGPAQVFFGFEHAPYTQAQANTVKDAIAALNRPSEFLFALAENCSVSVMRIDAPFTVETLASSAPANAEQQEAGEMHDEHAHPGEEAHHHSGHEAHDEHEHDGEEQHPHSEEAAHEKHEHYEEDDDHAEHEHGDSAHSELQADYVVSCPARGMMRFELIVFDRFPELEAVEAAWLDATGGGSAALTPSTRSVTLKLD